MDQCPNSCIQNQVTTITAPGASQEDINIQQVETTRRPLWAEDDTIEEGLPMQAIMVARACYARS
jgi:hypothetical protein